MRKVGTKPAPPRATTSPIAPAAAIIVMLILGFRA
jgi:hypothetical protein